MSPLSVNGMPLVMVKKAQLGTCTLQVREKRRLQHHPGGDTIGSAHASQGLHVIEYHSLEPKLFLQPNAWRPISYPKGRAVPCEGFVIQRVDSLSLPCLLHYMGPSRQPSAHLPPCAGRVTLVASQRVWIFLLIYYRCCRQC